MKYLQRSLTFLIAGLLVLITGILFSSGEEREFPDVDRIAQKLEEKEASLDALLEEFAGSVANGELDFKTVDVKFMEPVSESGFSFFVYDDDSLVYWSDNHVFMDWKIGEKILEERIVFLDNSWHELRWLRKGNYYFVGLIFIKSQYEYENGLLENSFENDFEICKEYEVSVLPYYDSWPVTDANGEYLFTLRSSSAQVPATTPAFIFYLFVLSLVLFFVFQYYGVLFLNHQRKSNLWLFALFADLLIFKFLIQYFSFPSDVYALDLFGPKYYASSGFLVSLGDFTLNALFLFFFSLVFYKVFFIKRISGNKNVSLWIAALTTGVFFGMICGLIENLIFNSNLSFDTSRISEIGLYTGIGYLAIALLLGTSVTLSIKILSNLRRYFSTKELFLGYILVQAVFLGLWFLVFPFIAAPGAIILVVLLNVIVVYSMKNQPKLNYPSFVLIALLFAIFISVTITLISTQKEKNNRKVISLSLATERDPVVEILLEDLEQKILSDETLKENIRKGFGFQSEIFNYLKNKYFFGFWTKYETEFTICSGIQDYPNDNSLLSCANYFNKIIRDDGIKLPESDFYFINNQNGKINYLGVLNLIGKSDTLEAQLYIQLESKLINRELGYPELLMVGSKNKNQKLADYSYAKYSYNQLVTMRGDFPYDLDLNSFAFTDGEYAFATSGGFNHLIYRVDELNSVVISIPARRFVDYFISLGYIFVFLYLFTTIVYLGSTFRFGRRRHSVTWKARIQIAMILVLSLSLLLIGTGTVYYNIRQYKENQNNLISEKIQSVLMELTHKLGDVEELSEADSEYLTLLLIKWSNVFFSDINLYDLNGKLLASSRPEIYEKGLIAPRMNINAYYQLRYNNKAKVIHDEYIGRQKYVSVYVPYSNTNKEQLAYLNLPYFTKQNELTKEITGLVVTIVNIYLVLFLITIFIGILITNRLTMPLRLIRQSIRQIGLNKDNTPIRYTRDDELGELIKEYNRMIDELENSAVMLARSERETAWREMAKQIAHEIKNPLTPMKLSVQHLQRSWSDKVSDWDQRFERVSQTLIEQIDTLTAIANEFSSFAKMPTLVNERVNLKNKLNSSVNLFSDNEKVDFELDLQDSPAYINADKEQIIRVFNNIIKNAIQAIPRERKGLIRIRLYRQDDQYVVEIADNGTGIAEDVGMKLFEPNFTTKTSGMGLGLAMVKNIVESSGGFIGFETRLGEGTTFFVKFPAV